MSFLLIFTATYPYDGGAEQTFLDSELQELCQKFDRVILVPRKCTGKLLSIPKNVEIDTTYSMSLKFVKLITAFFMVVGSHLLYKEFISRPELLIHPNTWIRLARFLSGAFLTKLWVEEWLSKNASQVRRCIFYTYWFDQAALGIGLVKNHWPGIKLVSRAHGYDLYEEYYYRPPYWPCRRTTLSNLDRLFPDSQAGLIYLKNHYPEYTHIYSTQLLGTPDPGSITPASRDGVFRVVSCSILRPVKRIELLMKAIAHAAGIRPNKLYEWHHLGNGISRMRLQEEADRTFPPNAKAFLPGYIDQVALFEYYRTHPIDVFVNLSISEGTPITLMEAASFGIPLIATSVGGNVEIVSNQNGILISPNPTLDEIATALFKIADDPTETVKMKQKSRKIWEEKYHGEVNFHRFANVLKNLGDA